MRVREGAVPGHDERLGAGHRPGPSVDDDHRGRARRSAFARCRGCPGRSRRLRSQGAPCVESTPSMRGFSRDASASAPAERLEQRLGDVVEVLAVVEVDVAGSASRSSRTRGRSPSGGRDRSCRRASSRTARCRRSRAGPRRPRGPEASASSIGTYAVPNRTIPRLSPRASWKALPRQIPTSSTVWWRSTSVSPRAPTAEVEQAVLARRLEHVVEERDRRVDRHVAAPIDVQLEQDLGLPRPPLDPRHPAGDRRAAVGPGATGPPAPATLGHGEARAARACSPVSVLARIAAVVVPCLVVSSQPGSSRRIRAASPCPWSPSASASAAR